MRYCPTCEKPYPEDDFNCPDCGYSPKSEKPNDLAIEKTQEIITKDVPPDTNIITTAPVAERKPLLKNPLFWGGGGLAVLIIIGLVTFLAVRPDSGNSDEYQIKLTKIWREVIRDSNKIINKAKKVKNENDLTSFADDIDDFTSSAKDHRSDIEDLEAPPEFSKAQKDLADSFDDLDEYFDRIYSLVSKDATQVKPKNFVPLANKAKNAKKSLDLVLVDLVFLKSIPPGLYKISAKIRPVYSTVWKKKKADKLKAAQIAKDAEEKKKAETLKQQQLQQQIQQQKQLEQNISQAESVVRNFLSAYISSTSTSRMRFYLSGEALSQFKPDIEFQGDFDHVGYSVVSRELTPLKNYRFYVHIKSKDWEGVYFSDKYKFVVGKVGSSYKIIRRQYIDRVN